MITVINTFLPFPMDAIAVLIVFTGLTFWLRGRLAHTLKVPARLV